MRPESTSQPSKKEGQNKQQQITMNKPARKQTDSAQQNWTSGTKKNEQSNNQDSYDPVYYAIGSLIGGMCELSGMWRGREREREI